jgi:hypothetical protein
MPEQLVAMPHSGLRVPNTDLHVTSARTMQGTDGEMLNATLRLRDRIVGRLVNEGRGGATFFQSTGTSFGWRDLEAYVAACRTPAGEPVPEEHVLDLLVDEYRTDRDIAASTERNLTPLRLCEVLHGLTFRIGEAIAKPITTPARRRALVTELARSQAVADGEWWQLWTGTGWEDLTDRPTTT